MAKTIHGLDMFHVAILTEDTYESLKYEKPERLPGAVNVSIDPKSESDSFYADNGTYDVTNSLGDIDVEIEVADLPLKLQEKIYNQKRENGVQFSSKNDQTAYIALGFRAKQSNSENYRYTWLLKGLPSLVGSEHKTDEASTERSVPKISIKFMPVDYGQNRWKATAEDGDSEFTNGKNWFNDVVFEGSVFTQASKTTTDKS